MNYICFLFSPINLSKIEILTEIPNTSNRLFIWGNLEWLYEKLDKIKDTKFDSIKNILTTTKKSVVEIVNKFIKSNYQILAIKTFPSELEINESSRYYNIIPEDLDFFDEYYELITTSYPKKNIKFYQTLKI